MYEKLSQEIIKIILDNCSEMLVHTELLCKIVDDLIKDQINYLSKKIINRILVDMDIDNEKDDFINHMNTSIGQVIEKYEKYDLTMFAKMVNTNLQNLIDTDNEVSNLFFKVIKKTFIKLSYQSQPHQINRFISNIEKEFNHHLIKCPNLSQILHPLIINNIILNIIDSPFEYESEDESQDKSKNKSEDESENKSEDESENESEDESEESSHILIQRLDKIWQKLNDYEQKTWLDAKLAIINS